MFSLCNQLKLISNAKWVCSITFRKSLSIFNIMQCVYLVSLFHSRLSVVWRSVLNSAPLPHSWVTVTSSGSSVQFRLTFPASETTTLTSYQNPSARPLPPLTRPVTKSSESPPHPIHTMHWGTKLWLPSSPRAWEKWPLLSSPVCSPAYMTISVEQHEILFATRNYLWFSDSVNLWLQAANSRLTVL